MIDNTQRFKDVEESRTFGNICDLYSLRDKRVLDIGCGYGQYLRNFGSGSVGITTSNEEVEFGKVHDLDICFGNAEHMDLSIGKEYQAIWANNLYEHLLSPHAFLMKLKKFSHADALIIIGVPVVPWFSSLMYFRWWRGALASNHVNFFTYKTIGLTITYAGWMPLAVRPFIFKNSFLDFLIRPFAPHMYVVAKNDPDFKYPPKKIHEWIEDEYYKDLLLITDQNG